MHRITFWLRAGASHLRKRLDIFCVQVCKNTYVFIRLDACRLARATTRLQ
jgi:hypothetical protein